MKKVILFFSFLLCICAYTYGQDVNLVPVQDEKSGLFGFKTTTGDMVTGCQYEDYAFTDEFIVVVKHSKVGFLNYNGMEVIPCLYDYNAHVDEDAGAIYISKDGVRGVIDFLGNVLVPFKYDDCSWDYLDHIVTVCKNGKYGLVSLEEKKEILPPIYDKIKTARNVYDDGIVYVPNPAPSNVFAVQKNDKWGFVNFKGTVIIPCTYDNDKANPRTNMFVNGVSIVKKDGKYGLIDLNGKIVCPIKYKKINLDFDGFDENQYRYYVQSYETEKWSLFSSKGKQLCNWYDNISNTGDLRAAFKKGNKYGIVNLETSLEVVSAKYDDIDCFSENFARVKLGDKYGYVNTTTGKEVFECKFQDGGAFTRGYCRVKNNDKWGFIRASGYDNSVYIPCRYEDCSSFEIDDLAVVKENGLYGLVNMRGKLVVDCIYENIYSASTMYEESYSALKYNTYKFVRKAKLPYGSSDDGWGVIDSEGNEIVECKYSSDAASEVLKAYLMQNEVSDVDRNIPKAKAQDRSLFAVIIANEDYTEVGVSKVEYAKNDGAVFKEYCEKTLGVPSQNIRYRENATMNNIRSDIHWLSDVAKAYDGKAKIIFYYAGHGIPNSMTEESFLLPIDGLATDVRSAYSLSELYAELGALPAEQITVFMDACFSGTKRDGNMLSNARGAVVKAKAGTPKGNMVVFSAAQGSETAYHYGKKKHGMFTYFLLKKLQETKGDVSLEELGNYIIQQVKQHSPTENGHLQTPTIQVSPDMTKSLENIKL